MFLKRQLFGSIRKKHGKTLLPKSGVEILNRN